MRYQREDLRVQKQRMQVSSPAPWMTQHFKLDLGNQGKGQCWCSCPIYSFLKQGPVDSQGLHVWCMHSDFHLLCSDLFVTLKQKLSLLCSPVLISPVGYPLLCGLTCPCILHPQSQLEEEPAHNWYFIIAASVWHLHVITNARDQLMSTCTASLPTVAPQLKV